MLSKEKAGASPVKSAMVDDRLPETDEIVAQESGEQPTPVKRKRRKKVADATTSATTVTVKNRIIAPVN